MTSAPPRPRWRPAYIGLGSNLDSPISQIRSAIEQLAAIADSRLIKVSSLYRSAPMGPADQPEYINAAASMLTQLDALSLLRALQAIETSQGRVRGGRRWGPRTLDLDLLSYASERRDEPDLTLPHPGIIERNFVLFPLLDIAPHMAIPGEATVLSLATALDTDSSTLQKLEV